MKLVVMAAFAALTICANSNALAKDWPVVSPARTKAFVTNGNARVVLKIFSKTTPSKQLYELRCDTLDVEDDDGPDYHGMFECKLYRPDSIGSDNLFRTDEKWQDKYETRGSFGYEQVLGPCKSNPDFGLSRSYFLREMRLDLTISNFNSPSMADMLSGKTLPTFSFNFEASVSDDRGAVSGHSAPIRGEYCGGEYELDKAGKAVYVPAIR